MTDYTISAVDEALALLLIVAQKPGLGVTELAKASGNTKARAFRILFTLEQRNFVLRKNPGPCYFLDIQALYIGVAAQEQIALVRTARQYLLALGRECNENVQLRVRDGLECVCIDHWQSTRTTKMKSGAGSRRKLHAGASCKLLLAYAPPEVKHALLNSELLRYSKNTITQRSKLTQELSKIISEGFASSDGEITPDVMAIAVPIFDAQNEVVIGYNAIGAGSNTVQLGNTSVTNVKTSGTITANAITYPNTAGTNGQVLTSNGAGDASWISPTTVSVGTISSTSNANGATITSGVLNLTPADETNGGIITTGTQTFAGLKTFNDGINYIKVNSSSTLDQSNISSDGSVGGTSVWQSFTAGINGILSSVEWEMQGGPTPDRRIAVNIYNGEGNSGTLLGTANGMIPLTRSFVAFDLSSSNIKVMAGQIYTIQATTVLNASSRFNFPGVYAGGRSSAIANGDFVFKTYVKAFSTDSYLPLSGGALTGDLSTSGTLTAGGLVLKTANIEMQGQIVDLKEQLLQAHKQLQLEQLHKRPTTKGGEGRRQ